MTTDTIKKNKAGIAAVAVNLLLTGEYVLALDLFATGILRVSLSSLLFPVALIALFVLISCLPVACLKKRMALSLLPPAVFLLIAVFYAAVYGCFHGYCDYKPIQYGTEKVFSDKKVMVIVPHEDDDLNVVSGVIEKYIENGSEIYTVFTTNGDLYNQAEMRINDAISCWHYLGVPEKNIIFLGYGDRWASGSPHLYNAPEDEVIRSGLGRTETYGTASHPAYHNGTPYTFRNFSNDLMQLILEKRPDVLFICDYDRHPDHKAASLFSEYVFGKILREYPDYKPLVYKGYAYSTAWEAVDDFRGLNLKSTQKPADSQYEPMVYDWKERVRFPVNPNSLSRSILSTKTYHALMTYRKQSVIGHTGRVINSDKVFWQRRTDSLLYNSEIKASSGDVSFLTDFRIIDNVYINDPSRLPYDRVWIPDSKDKKKTVRFVLKEKSDIASIQLYDHPSPDDNITNIKISFSDGSHIETGRLNSSGAVTAITVNKKKISYFDITVLSSEGVNAGLCEVEAFRSKRQKDDTFIKLTDQEGNFVYDYIAESDTSAFRLYSNNEIPELSDSHYSLACDNAKCACVIRNDRIEVTCPEKESCTVELTELSSGVSDIIHISNPGAFAIAANRLVQKAESDYICFRTKDTYKNLHAYRFFFKES